MASVGDEADHPEESQSSSKCPYKDPDDGRQRFLLELEFVQCLANPTYIHYLAQNRYFEDEAFIGYLKYLQYWQRPEYIKFIMYPHCLFFLELLQNSNFRNAMAHPGVGSSAAVLLLEKLQEQQIEAHSTPSSSSTSGSSSTGSSSCSSSNKCSFSPIAHTYATYNFFCPSTLTHAVCGTAWICCPKE